VPVAVAEARYSTVMDEVGSPVAMTLVATLGR
jgi:hypothetical protein